MKTQRGLFGCNQDLKGVLFCCPASHLKCDTVKEPRLFRCMNPAMATMQVLPVGGSNGKVKVLIEKWELDYYPTFIHSEYSFDVMMWFGE